ncbi:MAG: hypothetical protein M1830_003877 [Pleopsidium flavum]|nr:MAG: hypothetical protein M1830_003877 [Pleopsidium flavum]
MDDAYTDFSSSLLSRRQERHPPGPPYAPSPASILGGVPTVQLDVPITAVFLALFLGAAVCHYTIFLFNKRRGHKFLLSGFLFAFCMARTTTCIMRIVWATRPTSVPITIAASVLVAAGVVVLYIVNLIFAQRILRASHPRSGWHPLFNYFFIAIYALIVITLFLLIAFIVQSFYTLDPDKRRIARDVQLYGGTFTAVMSFLPIPLILGALVIPRKVRPEKFGSGRFRSKIWILISATFLLSLSAWFRTGTNYLSPRPQDGPPWYRSKACFYAFQFAIELSVVWLYIVVRVDKRFHVPDGSKGPGDYSRRKTAYEEEKQVDGTSSQNTICDEDIFYDVPGQGAGEEEKQVGETSSQNTICDEDIFYDVPGQGAGNEDHKKTVSEEDIFNDVPGQRAGNENHKTEDVEKV